MTLTIKHLCIPALVLLSACNASTGDDGLTDPPVDDGTDGGGSTTTSGLSDAPDSAELQRLSILQSKNDSGVTTYYVDPSVISKSDITLTEGTTTLDYVSILEGGDVVGMAIETRPSSASFSSEGTASAYLQEGENSYTMTGGDVSASISGDGLTVNLSWAGETEIDYVDGQGGGTTSDATSIGLTLENSTTEQSGSSATNIFWGGNLTVLKDDASAAQATLSADQAMVGVYGTDADTELGGVLNYEDPNTLTVSGQFVAD